MATGCGSATVDTSAGAGGHVVSRDETWYEGRSDVVLLKEGRVARLDETTKRRHSIDPTPGFSRPRRTPPALWFISMPVLLMAVLAVVFFSGDWTYLALTGAMVLVVLGMVYVERRRAERLLPPGYQGLLAEIIEGGSTGTPPEREAREAVERLVHLQEEMDAMGDRQSREIRGLDPRLAIWAGVLGSVLWLAATAAALVVDELRGAAVCLLMAAFFAGLAWFTHSEKKRRERTVAMFGNVWAKDKK